MIWLWSVKTVISWLLSHFFKANILKWEISKHFRYTAVIFLTMESGNSCMTILSHSNNNIPFTVPQNVSNNESVCVCVCAIAQSCSTLCDPLDCSPIGSSVHGIFQVRILKWAAISILGDLSDPGLNPLLLHCRHILYHWAIWEAHSNER